MRTPICSPDRPGREKTSTARILATSLNCEESPGAEPCGECAACRSVPLGDYPDVLEIDAASNGGIDNVRSLIEFVATRPVKARRKVVVVDECHQLSSAASNALLKTLEEPPSGVVFILCTTERNAVLETIKSRCQELSFRPLQTSEIEANLSEIAEQEGITITESALSELARASKGGLRDAQSLLGQLQVLGTAISADDVWEIASQIPEPLRHTLLGNVVKGDLLSALEDARELTGRGHQVQEILGSLRACLRDLMLVQLVPEAEARLEATDAGKLRLKGMVDRKSYAELKAIAEVLARGLEQNHQRCLRGPVLLDLVLIEAVQVKAAPVAIPVAAAVPMAEPAAEPVPVESSDPTPAAAEPAADEEPAKEDDWQSLLSKLPSGRVKDKLAGAKFLNLTNSELVLAGPASLKAIAPAAGKVVSEVLGRPISVVRRAE